MLHEVEVRGISTKTLLYPHQFYYPIMKLIFKTAFFAAFSITAPLTILAEGPDNFISMNIICDTYNPADDQGHGDIDYAFAIGETEITNTQYSAFLNAVANVTDKHALYHEKMSITRNQDAKTKKFTYKADPQAEHNPVTYVDAPAAMRFVNWLENGRPTTFPKPQDLDDATEVGTYKLQVQITGLSSSIRQYGTHYALVNLDEWTKAAYYNPEAKSFNNYTDSALPSTSEAKALNCCNKGHKLVNGSNLPEEGAYSLKGLSGNALELLEDFIPAGTFFKKYYDQKQPAPTGGRFVRGSAYDILEKSDCSYLHRSKYKVRGEGAEARKSFHNVGFRVVYIYSDDAICEDTHDEL